MLRRFSGPEEVELDTNPLDGEVLVPPVASPARRWCSCVLWGCSLTGVSFHVEVKPLKLTGDDCCLSEDTLANIFGDHRIDCLDIEACWPEDGYPGELFIHSAPSPHLDQTAYWLSWSLHFTFSITKLSLVFCPPSHPHFELSPVLMISWIRWGGGCNV